MTAPAKPPIAYTPDELSLLEVAKPLAEAGVQAGSSKERAILSRAFLLVLRVNGELRERLAEVSDLCEDLMREREGRPPKAKRKVIGG
jgi:hypothetical protein